MRRAIPWVLLPLLLAPSAQLAWKWRDMPQLGWLGDDTMYWIGAKSLAEGSGYRILSFPEQPHQTKYPPLFPLYLAAVWRLNPDFPSNVPLGVAFAWAWLPALLIVAWAVFRSVGVGRVLSYVLLAALAINPCTVWLAITFTSELMFTVLALAALALARRAEANPKLALLGGVAGAAAYLTRCAALPLLVSAPLRFALKRQYRQAMLFLAAMTPAVIAWHYWAWTHAARGSDIATLYHTSYFGHYLAVVRWGDLPRLLWVNFENLLRWTGVLIAPALSASVTGRYLSPVLSVFVFLGMWRSALRIGITQYHLFTAAYMAMLLLWHYPPSDRFLFPLLPLFLLWLMEEALRVARLARSTWEARGTAEKLTGATAAGVLVALLLAGAASNWQFLRIDLQQRLARERASLEGVRPAYALISRDPAKHLRCLANRDALVFLYARRLASNVPVPATWLYRGQRAAEAAGETTFTEIIRTHRLTHVLVTSRDFEGLPQADAAELRRRLRNLPGLRLLSECRHFALLEVPTERAPNPMPPAPSPSQSASQSDHSLVRADRAGHLPE